MARRRIEVRGPSERNGEICDRNLRWSGRAWTALINRFAPMSWSGVDQIPREGALLFLSNHVSLLDPAMTILAVNRCIHFMATQSAFMHPFLGRVLRTYGSVPKSKFASDIQAIRNLKRWCDLGRPVGLFPEGQRTWDGRLMEFIPGVETLVRLIKAPVVTFRIHNADRQWPRWAEKMRRGRVHLEFDAPTLFDRKSSPRDIHHHIQDRLTISPDDEHRWPIVGKDLALGLENPVFACPACYSFESIRTVGDDATCCRCGRVWRVDTLNVMNGRRGIADSYTITEAIDRIREHYGPSRVADPARHGSDGVIMQSEPMTLLDATHDEPITIGRGRLCLREETLEFIDSKARWRVDLCDLAAVSVEMRRRLQFRTPDGIFEAVMPTESVVKWEWFVEHWRLEAQPKERAKLEGFRAKVARGP